MTMIRIRMSLSSKCIIIIIIMIIIRYGVKLWVSIMAGVVLSDLTSAISLVTDAVQRVVRTIPNTPVKVMGEVVVVNWWWWQW